MLKRVIILLVAVFITSFIAFNLDYVYSELALLSESGDPQAYERGNINDSAIQASLFPISALRDDKRNEPAAVPASKPKAFTKEVAVLTIDKIGVRAPIVFEPTVNEDRIYKALEKGVVHYSTTPDPGQAGTTIILGHSSVYPWYDGNYGYVFANLSKLQSGDVISIEKNGQVLSYKVSRSLVFLPNTDNDFELRELESTNGSSLVLMTCWPTGTNAKRIAVRADLII